MLPNKSGQLGNALLFAIPILSAIGIMFYARNLSAARSTQAHASAAIFVGAAVFGFARQHAHRLPYWFRGPLENWSLSAYFAILLFAAWFFASAFFLAQ
jgi:hypothetical protein